jgi:colanic acid biosynthesis protein WcaH
LEISIGFDEAGFLGVFEHLYDDNFLGAPDVSTHYVVLAYEFHLSDNRPLVLDDQHSEVKWWHVEELLQDPGVHENTKAYFR